MSAHDTAENSAGRPLRPGRGGGDADDGNELGFQSDRRKLALPDRNGCCRNNQIRGAFTAVFA